MNALDKFWRTRGAGTWLRALAYGLAATYLVLTVADEERALTPSHSGVELFKSRQFEAARRVFQANLRSNPNDTEARLFLGWIALEEKKTDEAIDWVEQAARLARTNAVCFLWLGRLYGIKAREAGIAGGGFLARKARNTFEKAVALDPGNLEARMDLIRFHREAPAFVGGSRRSARTHANEINHRDPYRGALVHGDLLKDDRQFREAEKSYRSAVAMNSQRLEAYYRLGHLHQELGEHRKAFEAFEKILEIKPPKAAPYETTATEAYYHIGKTAALSGQRLDRAEETLKIYLNSKPDYFMPSLASAHSCLGTVYEKMGDLPAARAEYAKALALEPDHKEARAALRKLKLK